MRFLVIVYNIMLLIVQVRILAVLADFLLFGFRAYLKKNVYFLKSQGSRFNLLTNMFKFRKKSIFFFCIQNFSIPLGNMDIYNGLFLFVSKSFSVLLTF